MGRISRGGVGLTAVLMLAACGGNYSGAPVAGGSSGSGNVSGGSGFSSPQAFFTAEVEPNMSYCRTCHVPGGVADTAGTSTATQGNLFMLSSDASQDYANLMTSWTKLDKGVTSNKLLTNPSDPAQGHTGGQPWATTSQPYLAMQTLLSCWDNPDGCAALLAGAGGGPVAQQQSLLGSAHGGHVWDSYCAAQPDSAALPTDPRRMVVPGVNQNKAVYMNAYWQTCRADAEPKTCGELRQREAAGKALVGGSGAIGAGSEFAGNATSSAFAVSSDTWNKLWQKWHIKARPDNFDEVLAERYGTPLAATRNPYPLPGEDPNQSNGGSGQLPVAFTQLRNADGSWTGKVGMTCNICHSGQVGTAADGPGLGTIYGTNSLSDISVLSGDLGSANAALAAVALNKTRGTGNITNFQLFDLLTITDPASLIGAAFIQTAPSTGTEDPPVWWNVGHRPLKFFDGGLPMDATRIELSFDFPNAGIPLKAAEDWVLAHEADSTAWLASLKAPAYPGTIDTALAEQGAILFHSKDLWAPQLNNPVLKPDGGNGSCASCHGAYSPRFVNDTTYLDVPALEGIAAYIVPNAVIGTDLARVNGNSQAISTMARTNWFAYPDVPACHDQNDTQVRGSRALGYLAPPLYGVWATAPYLHNGSVPSVWEVLKPSDRHDIWRRVSAPAPAAQPGLVMGYDTSLARAYDSDKMGWKYEALSCGAPGVVPYLDCNPNDPAVDPLVQQILSGLYAHGGLLFNLSGLPILSDAQIEQRKIYNTHMYSQGNQGHEFTAVLTDQERRALIEYLKTL